MNRRVSRCPIPTNNGNTLNRSATPLIPISKRDVRLTMGGEPTFVSIDDPDGPEWNFTAVSQKKRILSGELIKRLRKKFAPGSLLHYGQGKWYPGEQLPRWALAAYWRKDGVPIWKDDSLIADEAKDYGHGAKEAKELLTRISRVVGADPKFLLPAYEDAFYYTWKERRLPSNVTPDKSNLKDKLERERIAKLFQRGLGEVAGYALPIKRAWYRNQSGWMSGAWFLRDDDTLWLIPGNSPMGLRLPLDSIPWVAEKDFPWVWQRDPSTPKLPELPREFPYCVRPETSGQRFLRGAVNRCQRVTVSANVRSDWARWRKNGNRRSCKRNSIRTAARAGRKRAVDCPHRALRRTARTDGCTSLCRQLPRPRITSI